MLYLKGVIGKPQFISRRSQVIVTARQDLLPIRWGGTRIGTVQLSKIAVDLLFLANSLSLVWPLLFQVLLMSIFAAPTCFLLTNFVDSTFFKKRCSTFSFRNLLARYF